MKRGTTSTGFVYEFDEIRLDDMRFVDKLALLVDPDAHPFKRVVCCSELLTMLLGEEQKAALYEHIGKAYGGRVPKADVEAALDEIMGATGKDAEKNS